MTAGIYATVMTTFALIGLVGSVVSTGTYLKELSRRQRETLISLEQMKDRENYLKDYLERLDLWVGAPIKAIAGKLNIVDGGIRDDVRGKAMILPPDKDGIMYVFHSPNVSANERTFNFAHECAHYINNDPLPASMSDQGMSSEEEKLADYVASALLIPADQFFKYLEKENFLDADKRRRGAMVLQMSKEYDVPPEIILRRIDEVYQLNGYKRE